MWRDILDYGRQLLELTQTVESNKKRIKELGDEVEQLSEAVRNMTYIVQHEVASLRQEMQHLRETERQARESEILPIKNAILRSGRQLPPADE